MHLVEVRLTRVVRGSELDVSGFLWGPAGVNFCVLNQVSTRCRCVMHLPTRQGSLMFISLRHGKLAQCLYGSGDRYQMATGELSSLAAINNLVSDELFWTSMTLHQKPVLYIPVLRHSTYTL